MRALFVFAALTLSVAGCRSRPNAQDVPVRTPENVAHRRANPPAPEAPADAPADPAAKPADPAAKPADPAPAAK